MKTNIFCHEYCIIIILFLFITERIYYNNKLNSISMVLLLQSTNSLHGPEACMSAKCPIERCRMFEQVHRCPMLHKLCF